MRYAALRGNGLARNTIFDLRHPSNRDDCLVPYDLLRRKFRAADIQIDTADIAAEHAITLEIHQNLQNGGGAENKYLLMHETDLVWPANGDASHWPKYRKIFTWNDDLVDGKLFIKLNNPNPIAIGGVGDFMSRDRFCCLIAGNKALPVRDERDLYPERVKAIRWFEANAPDDFDLYGTDWNLPEPHGGIAGRLEQRFWKGLDRLVTLRPFPSYRGTVGHKREVLARTRFSICYENVRDVRGYITEKIFDCFFSGCVPVYWGAPDIAECVPADCFVDRRRFRDTAEVYAFLREMSEETFTGYQRAIAAFLGSAAAYPFSSECFAETIVSTIMDDLGRRS